jgi:hypothetical protein
MVDGLSLEVGVHNLGFFAIFKGSLGGSFGL